MSVDEHYGSCMPHLSSLEEFVGYVQQCSLVDVPCEGNPYMWVGGRGLRLVKPLFDDRYSNLKVRHLSRVTSDHALLLLCARQQAMGPKSFCFSKI